MSKPNLQVGLALTLMLSLAALNARADIAPAGKETCSLDQLDTDGLVCESCRTSHEEPNACSDKYRDSEFTQQCRSSGASVWTEIWCTGEAKKKGCNAAGQALPWMIWPGLLWLLRRRGESLVTA